MAIYESDIFSKGSCLCFQENNELIGIVGSRFGIVRSHQMDSELLASPESDKFYIGSPHFGSYTNKQLK